jgi:hypothetical protein
MSIMYFCLRVNRFECLEFFARYGSEPNVHSCKRTLPPPSLGVVLPEEWCAKATKIVGRKIGC